MSEAGRTCFPIRVVLPRRAGACVPWRWLLSWLPRVIIFGVFIFAAASKMVDPSGFARAIHRYQLLPDVAVQPLAMTLPWLEITAAAGLLVWRRGRVASASILGVLLVVFSAAAASAWWRGLNVACGCFSTAGDTGVIGPWLFVRNGVLLATVAWAVRTPGRAPGTTAGTTAGTTRATSPGSGARLAAPAEEGAPGMPSPRPVPEASESAGEGVEIPTSGGAG